MQKKMTFKDGFEELELNYFYNIQNDLWNKNKEITNKTFLIKT
mgnify:CR=1 FL=1